MKVNEANDKSIEDLSGIDSLNTKIDEEGNAVLEDDDNEGLDPSESMDTLRKSIEESYSGPAPVSSEKKEQKKDDEDAVTVEDYEFYKGNEDDLDALVRDPKAFNAFMNGIYKKAIETTLGFVNKGIAQKIPGITKEMVSQQLTVRNAADKFYQDNEDLIPFKNTVGAFASKIAKENPTMTLDNVLKNAEKFVRKHLSLPKDTENKGNDKGAGPRFPKKPTGNRGNAQVDKLTGQAKEIDDMLKVM